MFNRRSATMKRAKFRNQAKAPIEKFLGNLGASLTFGVRSFGESLSSLDHNFDLPSLGHNVRQNSLTKMQESIPGDLPSPSGSGTVLGELSGRKGMRFGTEFLNKPVNQSFVSIGNGQVCGELRGAYGAFRITTHAQASLTIDNSGQIGQISGFVRNSDVFLSTKSFHNSMGSSLPKWMFNVQPQRLTPKTPKGEVIV